MSKNKPKRRKVWVNLYPDGRHAMYRTRKEALKIRALHSEGTAPFLERLPGDVVLSREDVARAMGLLDRAGSWVAASTQELRALLRGGR